MYVDCFPKPKWFFFLEKMKVTKRNADLMEED